MTTETVERPDSISLANPVVSMTLWHVPLKISVITVDYSKIRAKGENNQRKIIFVLEKDQFIIFDTIR